MLWDVCKKDSREEAKEVQTKCVCNFSKDLTEALTDKALDL